MWADTLRATERCGLLILDPLPWSSTFIFHTPSAGYARLVGPERFSIGIQRISSCVPSLAGSTAAQWSNYVHYSRLCRAFRQAGGERPAAGKRWTFFVRSVGTHSSLRGLWSIIGIRRQPFGPSSPPPFFFFFFFFLAPLADEGVLSSEIDCFPFSFVIDLFSRSHRNFLAAQAQCVATDHYYYPSDFRSECEERKERRKDMRSWGESCSLLFFIIDGWWLVETFSRWLGFFTSRVLVSTKVGGV